MKKLTFLFLTILTLSACGGEEVPQNTTKYLASNIVFSNSAGNKLLNKSIEGVDTETKIIAENVILDSNNLGLQADNVQSAFEEIAPDIKQLIVNAWDIIDFNNQDTPITGNQLIFLDDKTFSTPAVGTFGFLDYVPDATEIKMTYEIYEDVFIAFHREFKENGILNSKTSYFPIIKLTPTRIITPSFILNKI